MVALAISAPGAQTFRNLIVVMIFIVLTLFVG